MRKLCGALLLACALLTGCDVGEMSSLKDISRPYAAEYRCKKLLFGSDDLLGRFDDVKLTLSGDGSFTLSYAESGGKTGEFSGGYRLDGETISFSFPAEGKERSIAFRYEHGAVILQYLLGGKLLYAEFSATD